MKKKYRVLGVLILSMATFLTLCTRENETKYNEVTEGEIEIKRMAQGDLDKGEFVVHFFPLVFDVAQNYEKDFDLNAENIGIILCAIAINETSAEGSDGKFYPMKTDKAKQNNLYGLGIAYSYQDATNNWFKNLEASMINDEDNEPVKRYAVVYNTETILDFCNALEYCGYATDSTYAEKIYEISQEVRTYLTACDLINN